MPSPVAVRFGLLTISAGGAIPFGNETTRGRESCAARAVEISEQAERRERLGAEGCGGTAPQANYMKKPAFGGLLGLPGTFAEEEE